MFSGSRLMTISSPGLTCRAWFAHSGKPVGSREVCRDHVREME